MENASTKQPEGRGRPRRYCPEPRSCRQRAYQKRREAAHARAGAPQRLLGSDISDAFKLRKDVRQEVLRYLCELGVVPPGMSIEEMKAKLEGADLEAQYRLPAKRRRPRAKNKADS